MKRAYTSTIIRDLKKKMVFITGPRQVGKTHLAKEIMKQYHFPTYLNFDSVEDKQIIEQMSWPIKTDLLIFDEIHKMKNWKSFLKGVFDTREHEHILVTGSARLETFKNAGESLAGRYFRYNLLPLSLAELNDPSTQTLEKLLTRGGFPEPFLAEDDQQAGRWRKQYSEGLIREDVLDFERIHDFRAIKLLFELLRQRVGSPLSLNSLAEDIGVGHGTIKKYLQIFEDLYIIFFVAPYSKNIARSLKKESKIYFYDTGLIKGDDGLKLENLVALSLLKHQLYQQDLKGESTRLQYLRTKEKKEVDFCLVNDDTPKLLIEVKLTQKTLSKNLQYFHEKYQIPAIQLVHNLRQERVYEKIELKKASSFLHGLET